MTTVSVCDDCGFEESEDLYIHHQATSPFMEELEPNILLCDDCLFHAIDPTRESDDVSTWKNKADWKENKCTITL